MQGIEVLLQKAQLRLQRSERELLEIHLAIHADDIQAGDPQHLARPLGGQTIDIWLGFMSGLLDR